MTTLLLIWLRGGNRSSGHRFRGRISTVSAALIVLALCGCATSPPTGILGAGEPAYCDPAIFPAYEVTSPTKAQGSLRRWRSFQLGKVLLSGLAVGNSDPDAVRALAEEHSSGAAEGYCTWYLNQGSREASRAFNFRYVPHPGRGGARPDAEVYLDVLGSSFFRDEVSFVSCAEKRRYLAVGCDGMQHRGPTVFGMVLAFSGCSPEHASRIANDIWGLNGVPPGVRLEIIRAAYELGQANPSERARLRYQFSRQ